MMISSHIFYFRLPNLSEDVANQPSSPLIYLRQHRLDAFTSLPANRGLSDVQGEWVTFKKELVRSSDTFLHNCRDNSTTLKIQCPVKEVRELLLINAKLIHNLNFSPHSCTIVIYRGATFSLLERESCSVYGFTISGPQKKVLGGHRGPWPCI